MATVGVARARSKIRRIRLGPALSTEISVPNPTLGRNGHGSAWSRIDSLAMLRSLRKFGTVMSVNSTPTPVAGSALRTSARRCVPSPISSVSSISFPTGMVCAVAMKHPFRLIELTVPVMEDPDTAVIRAGIRQLSRLKYRLSARSERAKVSFSSATGSWGGCGLREKTSGPRCKTRVGFERL